MKLEFELPSLQATAIFKVCATLWNCSIDRCRIKYRKEKYRQNAEWYAAWLKIEDEVKAKILKLGLSPLLGKEVSRFVKPLGVEILKWCEFHCSNDDLDINMPNQFCWTSQGTIDLEKTAEGLVRDENLSPLTRYKLALFYCLESDILEEPLGCRYSLRGRNRESVELELVAFWNSREPWEIMLPKTVTHYDYMPALKNAVVRGNVSAVKYFLGKLKPAAQKQFVPAAVKAVLYYYLSPNRIYRAFPKEFYPRVFCFLFSLLDAEQQMDVLKVHSSEILECFVNCWPYQSFLLEIITLISDSIFPYACTSLLMKIADRVFERHEYYDYSQLFTEIWKQLSEYCKQEIVRYDHFGLLIMKLLLIKDEGNIRLILKDVEPARKKNILYSPRIRHWLATSDDCDLCELLIRECIPLRKDLIEFKEKLKELKLPDASDHSVNLLDSLIHEHDKRKCTEENYGNSHKKLAGAQNKTVHNAKKCFIKCKLLRIKRR